MDIKAQKNDISLLPITFFRKKACGLKKNEYICRCVRKTKIIYYI